jgi:hypothetical protein
MSTWTQHRISAPQMGRLGLAILTFAFYSLKSRHGYYQTAKAGV